MKSQLHAEIEQGERWGSEGSEHPTSNKGVGGGITRMTALKSPSRGSAPIQTHAFGHAA